MDMARLSAVEGIVPAPVAEEVVVPAVAIIELESLGEGVERWLSLYESSFPIEAFRVVGRPRAMGRTNISSSKTSKESEIARSLVWKMIEAGYLFINKIRVAGTTTDFQRAPSPLQGNSDILFVIDRKMKYFVNSVDRDYCVKRCHEIGVCFQTNIGYKCICDDGSVGKAWWLLGILIGLGEMMCIWWRRRASPVVEVVPNGEVVMLELKRGPGGDLRELQPAEEFFCLPLEELSLGNVMSLVGGEASE
ncbi:unnamed protein product [Nippostrongylus brasiliensis]|uniref:EGF-like domain-containing protein n=1 Tax=Nippostrongylus brasiliensis TaxID=27835 RepID=A0A0N4YHQ5_NIPBR|nr:unnamed protein product [Nippostrongylus brasiliensis]